MVDLEEKIMAKNKKLTGKEIRLIIGVALLVIAAINIFSFWNLLLLIFGGYLIYESLKK